MVHRVRVFHRIMPCLRSRMCLRQRALQGHSHSRTSIRSSVGRFSLSYPPPLPLPSLAHLRQSLRRGPLFQSECHCCSLWTHATPSHDVQAVNSTFGHVFLQFSDPIPSNFAMANPQPYILPATSPNHTQYPHTTGPPRYTKHEEEAHARIPLHSRRSSTTEVAAHLTSPFVGFLVTGLISLFDLSFCRRHPCIFANSVKGFRISLKKGLCSHRGDAPQGV